MFTSARLAIVGTAVVQFEASVIAITRRVTKIFDDGVLGCLLNDATGVSSATTQTSFFTTTESLNWTAELSQDGQDDKVKCLVDDWRYHRDGRMLVSFCDCEWIHVHTVSAVARLEWLTGPHGHSYPTPTGCLLLLRLSPWLFQLGPKNRRRERKRKKKIKERANPLRALHSSVLAFFSFFDFTSKSKELSMSVCLPICVSVCVCVRGDGPFLFLCLPTLRTEYVMNQDRTSFPQRAHHIFLSRCRWSLTRRLYAAAVGLSSFFFWLMVFDLSIGLERNQGETSR